ncbi:SPFH domain / Band 7 family protein [Abditibacterium utsteinense]|uniref:SPFH domain / Band 7 family protein n=1 Tax=Abditibacterium utsteinense TaxID=1960156 RepID=A0A2S8SVP0_9BACT|nr:SPFH domain-containing protein [Abditibacterium utsteinense]PQV64860.1 SPFH domain / Band 7 family protein [Abditibacterium utsteinense]
MLGLRFFKGLPTEYILRYRSGRVVAQGLGLAFWYRAFNTQIVAVPTASSDGNFVFNEVTKNFQAVTIQGQFTYRISDPQIAAQLLNFSVDPRSRAYVSGDPERIVGRIANVVQMQTRGEIQSRSLEEALGEAQTLAPRVLASIQSGLLLQNMGVELLQIYFVAVKPSPDMGKALEAPFREALLRRADEAVYARRAASIEEERNIKQKELSTDISLEENRRQLLDLQGENATQEAEFRGRALEQEATYRARATRMEVEVFEKLEPRLVLALAMRDLGRNAQKIGNLNITPEILSALLDARGDDQKG